MPKGRPREGKEKLWALVPTEVYEAILELMRERNLRNRSQATTEALVEWHAGRRSGVQNPSARPREDRTQPTPSGAQNPSECPPEGS